MKQLAIFDLDGTLLNTIKDLGDAVNYALDRNGFHTHSVASYPYFVGNGVRRLIERSLPEDARKSSTTVNTMLKEYERMCYESNREDDKRHWRIIEALYLSGTRTTALEVAERENMDKRTVYKNVDAAAEDLTTLLFGVEGIEKL